MKKLYILFLLLYVALGASAQEAKGDAGVLDESNFKRKIESSKDKGNCYYYQDSISLKPLVLRLTALPSGRRDIPEKIMPMYICDTVFTTSANVASSFLRNMKIADKEIREYCLACFKRLFPELVSKLNMIYKKHHDVEKEGEWFSFFSIYCFFGENGKVRSVQIGLNPVTYLELTKDEIMELYHGLRGIDCSSFTKYYEFKKKDACGSLYINFNTLFFEGIL